ncbi:peptidoglycan-N-acetylglucosamine deacetylase [Gammaproteobacteria bacterium]
MNIRKLLRLFLLVSSSVVFCGFYALAFADNNSSKSIIEESVSASLKNAEVNSEYPVMKGCLGIGRLKTTRKVVALTFDDGPHQKYTGEILEILKLNNIRATFFIVGKNAQSCRECENAIKIAYRNGNVIASHTYSHADLRKLTNDEIKIELTKTNDIVYGLIRERPALFRSPYGGCCARTAKEVSGLGFVSIAWSDMTNDYDAAHMTPEKIAGDIIRYVHPGAIIGLHDGGGNRERTVKALSIIINTLRNGGYEFLTIPELLNVEAYRIN